MPQARCVRLAREWLKSMLITIDGAPRAVQRKYSRPLARVLDVKNCAVVSSPEPRLHQHSPQISGMQLSSCSGANAAVRLRLAGAAAFECESRVGRRLTQMRVGRHLTRTRVGRRLTQTRV